MNLNERLRLIRALEEHRKCLEKEAGDDSRDPDFSCGRAAAEELRNKGLTNEEIQTLVDEINTRSVEIWELEELISVLKRSKGDCV